MNDMVEIERMRNLLVTVALTAIEDYQDRIIAARAGRRYISICNQPLRVRDEDSVIAEARRYYRSTDWREIADCIGIEATQQQIVQSILSGIPARMERSGTYTRAPRTGRAA